MSDAAAPEPDDVPSVLNAIEIHLRVVGPLEWDRIKKRFPRVFPPGAAGERKLYRWIKNVRERSGLGDEATRDGKALVKRRGAVNDAREALAKDIPTAPPPAYLEGGGRDRRYPRARADRIDFLGSVNQLHRDALKLRAYSVKEDPNAEDGEAIKNPGLFDISIKRRLDVINSAVAIQREVWDLQKMEEFYNAIIDEIGEVAPEVQRQIMERLAALNAEHGMTIHAKP